LQLKLKVRQFDPTEVIEEESQAVLNTLTKHDFQDAFKFEQTAVIVPEIMDCSLYT
jgi:hypothetical protein